MKTKELIYKELVYCGNHHQFKGIILKIGGYTHNGRIVYVKDNYSGFEIEVVVWNYFDAYFKVNKELKTSLEQSSVFEEINDIYSEGFRLATNNLFKGDHVEFEGTLYVPDKELKGKWNLVTRQDYSFKEKERIVVVSPYLDRIKVEQQNTLEGVSKENIEEPSETLQDKKTKFSRIKSWCVTPFRWFMNIGNFIQGFEWIQKFIKWFNKSDGNQ